MKALTLGRGLAAVARSGDPFHQSYVGLGSHFLAMEEGCHLVVP
jgi:hypothetical protein